MSVFAYALTRAPGLGWLRERWTAGITCNSTVAFAFAVSLTWLALYNVRFWQDTVDAMWHGNAASGAFLVSLFLFVWCAQGLLILLAPRQLMIGVTSGLFVVAAIASFFSAKYGVVINKDMMRNVLQTDLAEARDLLSALLIEWVIVLGIIPAIIVWKVRLPHLNWRRALRQRVIAIAGIGITSALALFSCSASYAVFFREHKPIRFALSPAAPVASALQLFVDQGNGRPNGPVINVSGPTRRESPPKAKPLVIVIVVGETARADNFQLGGYSRATNPRLLHEEGVVYFNRSTSCGTATAISVPCMFSHLGRTEFDVDQAARYANLLDALHEAGFDVEWRDNNAGCKGVCARVRQISYAGRTDPGMCDHAYCYDEIMLEGMTEKLRDLRSDTVIVMHAIGSHGPAYAERYPPRFETFKPACRSHELQHCSSAEIVNAYDNTILYTDYVVSQAITRLRDASDQVDSVLLYASDHGESLGEQGIYLHGLPYRFAPQTQKHVPMLMWTSRGYVLRRQLSTKCLQSESTEAISHDNIYHTVLGAAGVRNGSYDSKLDLVGACSASVPADHE